jgi:hypothetical protein
LLNKIIRSLYTCICNPQFSVNVIFFPSLSPSSTYFPYGGNHLDNMAYIYGKYGKSTLNNLKNIYLESCQITRTNILYFKYIFLTRCFNIHLSIVNFILKYVSFIAAYILLLKIVSYIFIFFVSSNPTQARCTRCNIMW